MAGFRWASLLMLAVAVPAFGDTVLMEDGDKLTGKIEKVTGESVEMVTKHAGRVTIERKAVKSMWSEGEVTVVGADGAARKAYVGPAKEGAGWVEATAAVPAPAVVPVVMKPAEAPVHYVDLERYWLPVGPHWKDTLVLGLVNTTGNTESTSFAGELAFAYKHGPVDYGMRFGGEYAVTEGKQNAGRFYNDDLYKMALTEWHADRWFVFAESHNVYDAIKRISFQSQDAVGLGYQLVKTEQMKLELRAGPGVTYEKQFDGTKHFDPSALVGLHGEYIFSERANVTEDIIYTNGLTDLERYHASSETALNIKVPELVRGAGIKFLFRDDYDSTTKSPAKNNDTRLVIGLTLDF